MDENRITGAAKELGGKAQSAVGDISGDKQTQAEGKANEIKGSAENLVGQAKDAIRDAADQATEFAQDALKRGRESFPDAERAYRQGSEAIGQYAKDSPLGILFAAAAFGHILSLVIHGKNSCFIHKLLEKI